MSHVNCMKLVEKHRPETVTEDQIFRALEVSAKGMPRPSEILPGEGAFEWQRPGKLYLGGMHAAMNSEFLASGVRLVVNTAKGLETFGPQWARAQARSRERGLELLELNWLDDAAFQIDREALKTALQVVHATLANASVLVHCAQGKSRSSTLVVAYLCVVMNMESPEALRYVQTRRALAEPNVGFMQRLRSWDKDGASAPNPPCDFVESALAYICNGPREAWSNGKRKFKAQDPVYQGAVDVAQMAHRKQISEKNRVPKGDRDACDIPPIFGGSMFGGNVGKDIFPEPTASREEAQTAGKKKRKRMAAQERRAASKPVGTLPALPKAAAAPNKEKDKLELPKQKELETWY
ncbi:unnamed protein product [Effrenium voratum]|uniref:protein-tyrosine-phosphatase n=1 Tax=Effrenium voratum TaxID=2562239 RepID=A0AA36JFQ7_9DINO|nr:unnamed protein product [Effrenium voratum]